MCPWHEHGVGGAEGACAPEGSAEAALDEDGLDALVAQGVDPDACPGDVARLGDDGRAVLCRSGSQASGQRSPVAGRVLLSARCSLQLGAMPKQDGSLKAREFVFFCEDQVLTRLPPAVPRPERHLRWTTLQFHFGDERVHFELQPQMGRGVVEVGLHFEGPVEANDAWVELLAAHAADLLGELGPAWELEEWTVSWRRLHRPFPFERLTAELAREVSGELVRAMTALHPLIEEGGGANAPAAPPLRASTPLRGHRRARR